MEKCHSEITMFPIVVEDTSQPIARIRDLVIDPRNGEIVAFMASRDKIISPMDVKRFTRYLLIKDVDDICDIDEVLRAREVIDSGIRILNSRVETKNGEYLGTVYDYSVDTESCRLKKIYVSKSILGLVRIDSRIITVKYIIEIRIDKIIVKDILAKIPIEELHQELKMEEEMAGG